MTIESPRAEDMRMDLGTMVGAVLSRWVRILAVTLLLLAATYTILMFTPKMYESSASILVESRENAFTRPAGVTTATSGAISAESAISSQIELIKSRDTLLKVIDTENLRSVAELNGSAANPLAALMSLLGRKPEARSLDETVLANLYDRLTVIRERDSAFISILVRAEDSDLAARIANAIANAHVQRRAELSLQDTAEASAWLEEAIVQLRQRVTEAETAVADFRAKNDLFQGANNTTLLDQQLTNIATQITAAQERRNAAQARANLIRGLVESGQRIDNVADVRNSVTIQQLSQSRANLQGQLAERASTLLPNHPTIRALQAQIVELDRQLSEEGRRVVASLETEARIEEDLAASLQGEMARMKLTASNAATSTVTLDGLEREAKAQRDLLESYLARYREAVSRSDTNSALPDVRVVTLAAASVSPASPKSGLILGAVAFVALALQIGAIMFGELMSGRAVYQRVAYLEEPEAQPEDPDEPMLPFDDAAVEAMLEAEERIPYDEAVEARDDTAPEEFDDEPAPADADEVPLHGDFSEPDFVDAPIEEKAVAPAPGPRVPEQHPSDIASLSADIALGRVRIVMVAGLSFASDCGPVADALVTECLRSGITVVRVDAGSGRISADPGVTDLAVEQASFGDIVEKGAREGLAEVHWGQQPVLDRHSTRPLTLVEALTDIYEVVIVLTGRVGMTSSLPVFAGTPCRLVLVAAGRTDPDAAETALRDARALGFEEAQIMPLPQHQAVA